MSIQTELSPPPVLSSDERPWSGMTVQLHDWQSGGSVVSPVVDHDIVAMRVTGSVRLTQHRAGKAHRGFANPGNVTIHPRGFESRWSWDRPGAIVIARVPQELLAQAADASVKRAGAVELRNCFGARDRFVEPIMGLFVRELRQPEHPVQELITGCLSVALAAHLVQRFNVQATVSVSDPGGLESHSLARVLEYMHMPETTPITLAALAEAAGVSRFHFARMFRRSVGVGPVQYLKRIRASQVEAPPSGGLANWQVRRVTAYMQDHIDRDMSLDELAKLIGIGRFHFCTAFRIAVGQTPREWLIDRRIELARELLTNPALSITEVALTVGYTPSAFGAVFRKQLGMTPSAYRRAS